MVLSAWRSHPAWRQLQAGHLLSSMAALLPLQAAKAKAKKYMGSDGDDYDVSEGSDDDFAAKRKVRSQNEAPWCCRSSVALSLPPWLQADQLLDVFCTAACWPPCIKGQPMSPNLAEAGLCDSDLCTCRRSRWPRRQPFRRLSPPFRRQAETSSLLHPLQRES